MKQTIEIEVPDDKISVWEDGNMAFKDVKPPLPKTWLEFAKTQDYEKTLIAGVPKDIAKKHIALLKLHKLRDYYRQGWKPNWLDDNFKWVISSIFGNEIEVHTSVIYSLFLSFQTKELAEEFLNNFRDLIEQAGDLI